ncbi:hypothetical protein Agub_g1903 [Astrephomene gubernaculifera]|uniref:Uncharacterized protein n=1 Tax=Astrephomene gubernaculifera TaxID=47775 RepID=A0AAD3DG83_9CHLO|nr:hypothetical protein Agub_g1903 [Astrephomene gubernaculifera]
MSKKWWTGCQTTTGRGIFSQYNPDSIKEWVEREQKIPRKMPSPDLTLGQLRSLQKAPINPEGFITALPEPQDPTARLQQPLKLPTLPQYAHHHHFGWLPPSPERRIGGSFTDVTASQSGHSYAYGIANDHNQRIHNTHMAISTRKP